MSRRAVAAILAVLFALCGLVVVVTPLPSVTPPPAQLRRPIDEFGRTLVSRLERPVWTQARYLGAEVRRSDRLTILFFELRSWPGRSERAYLVSRCVDLDSLDPAGMGGGIVDGDPATDRELLHLRSDAQPPCGPPDGR